MELTSVLTNKLNFLEVSRKGMSSLNILLIEMEVQCMQPVFSKKEVK